jgi:hypothetical protein
MVDDILQKKITSQKEFSKLVENFIHQKNTGVMEAIIKVCEDTGVDPADCNRMLSASIKAKLEAEAMELNLIPRGNQLPL